MKAIIYGAGSIGALKADHIDNLQNDYSLTHACAISRSKHIELLGIIDQDESREIAANMKWKTYPVESDVREGECDIVVIACNTESHLSCFRYAIGIHKPKIVVLEKPCCDNLIEFRALMKEAEESGITVYPNYSRRYIPYYWDLSKRIMEEAPFFARLLYGRGIKRDGCHAFDIFNWWFGELRSWSTGADTEAEVERDRLLDGKFEYKSGVVVRIDPISSKKVGIFEIEVFTEKGRHVLSNNGSIHSIFGHRVEDTFGNYCVLEPIPEIKRVPEFNRFLDNLYRRIADNDNFLCEEMINSAEEVHKIFHNLGIDFV